MTNQRLEPTSLNAGFNKPSSVSVGGSSLTFDEEKMTITHGYRYISIIRKFLFGCAIVVLALSFYQEINIGSFYFPIIIITGILYWYEFRQWDIDKENRVIRFSDSSKSREIKSENISQVITYSRSIRVFYNDGSDLRIPILGLPKESLHLIKEILNIEPAVGAYGENAS